jgi:hypothetical protein
MKKDLKARSQGNCSIESSSHTVEVIGDTTYDADYTLLTIKSLHGLDTFLNVKKLLDESIQIGEQLTRFYFQL